MLELSPLLAVWAHPDDETFVSAGLMQSIVAAGGRVVVVHATRGEAGSQDHERWPPEKMGRLREGELADALAVLGVEEHHWLDYIDGRCEEIEDAEAVTKIAALIAEIQPRAVITFDEKGGTGHPDHICVSRWTRAAFETAAPEGSRLYHVTQTPEWIERWCPVFEPYNVFAPGTPIATPREKLAFVVALDEDMLDTKIKALQAQSSQTGAIFDMFGEQAIRDSQHEEQFVLVTHKQTGESG